MGKEFCTALALFSEPDGNYYKLILNELHQELKQQLLKTEEDEKDFVFNERDAEKRRKREGREKSRPKKQTSEPGDNLKGILSVVKPRLKK